MLSRSLPVSFGRFIRRAPWNPVGSFLKPVAASMSILCCQTSNIYRSEMPTRKNTAPVQLTLDSARKPTGRGGWRPNAGRPKGRTSVAHEQRPEFSSRIPQHVTLRLVDGLPTMRDGHLVGLLRTQIALSQRHSFRIIEFSIQDNHLHFIIEASDEDALASGCSGLMVRIARRINRELGRRGDFFEERYHCR